MVCDRALRGNADAVAGWNTRCALRVQRAVQVSDQVVGVLEVDG
jgi:hypothetical protein